MSESYPLIRYVIAGTLTRQYTLLPKGQAVIDQPGGSLISATGGLGMWDQDLGLIGRVGSDYPAAWLKTLTDRGFDVRGIKVLQVPIEQRAFAYYSDFETRSTTDPLAHFARLGLNVPQSLLGFNPPQPQIDSRTQPTNFTLRLNDFPGDYKDATAAHICPLDYLSHILLPSALRQGRVTTLTLDPGANYMLPAFWDDIPAVVKGLTALLVSEEKLTALFQGRSGDLWEMAETICAYGCEMIVIKRGGRGQYLYVHATRERWMIPAYPARVVNPAGAGDAFCGGFLAGYRKHYQPLQAALYGNISTSFMVEGHDPLYPLDALPGLAQARMEALRDSTHRM